MKKLIVVSLLLVAWANSYAQNITAQEAFAMIDAANFQQAAAKLKAKGYKYQQGYDYTNEAGLKAYEYGYKCNRDPYAFGNEWTVDKGVTDWTYVHLLVEPRSNKLCSILIAMGTEKRFLSYAPIFNAKGYKEWQSRTYGAIFTNKDNGSFILVKTGDHFSVEIKNKYIIYKNTVFDKYKSGGDGNPAYFAGFDTYFEWHRKKLHTELINPDISTKVDVEFVVERDGSITNIKTSQAFDPFSMEAAKEVERVLGSMPNWTPARENGVAERALVKMTIPFGNTSSKSSAPKLADRDPSYPGGEEAMKRFIESNRKYPRYAAENGIQGRVIVGFTVQADGSLTDVHVKKSVDPQVDAEAIRVVKSMPRWNPGKRNGVATAITASAPVVFVLR